MKGLLESYITTTTLTPPPPVKPVIQLWGIYSKEINRNMEKISFLIAYL